MKGQLIIEKGETFLPSFFFNLVLLTESVWMKGMKSYFLPCTFREMQTGGGRCVAQESLHLGIVLLPSRGRDTLELSDAL